MDLVFIVVAVFFLFFTLMFILEQDNSWVFFTFMAVVCAILVGFFWTYPEKTTEIVTITDRHQNMSFNKPVKMKTITKHHDWTILRDEIVYEVNVD